MTGYAALSGTQIDADSPLIEDTMIKLRDNPLAMFEGAAGAPRLQTAAMDDSIVTNAKMADNSVGYAEMISGAIHQAELNTSMGEVSTTSTALTNITLPGGQYGFYPSVTSFHPVIYAISGGINTASDSWATNISIDITATSVTQPAKARQRYINSSPPYNLGDGDIPLFFFGLMRAGKLVSTYAADVPPWGYNGPTSVMADFKDAHGVKFKRKKTVDKESGEVITEIQEITHVIKNADMELIPHPFASTLPGDEVILLNPPDTLGLLDMHNAGESIAELFSNDYLRFDNSPISRATPAGVKARRYKWRNSKKNQRP